MSRRFTKSVLILLVISICFSMMPIHALAADKPMDKADMQTILNATEVHPQRTGYSELDNAIAKILKPCKDADTYTKVKTLYDWTVKNVSYSWEYYSKTKAPAYEFFTKTYKLTNKNDLQDAFPMDMIYRSYHSITAKKGVCYDYAILFAIMARYVGLEAYVHTGYYDFEDWSGISGSGHHGWTEIVIGEDTYVFDPQRDNRYSTNQGKQMDAFFGIPWSDAWRYKVELDTEANEARDAEMLPLTEHRHYNVKINVTCSPSGSGVSGKGTYLDCEEITLKSSDSTPVREWYASDGTLLSSEPSYNPTPGKSASVIAMFENDHFLDVPANAWFAADVNEATERNLAKGTATFTFEPDGALTRAMVVQFLVRVDGADVSDIAAAPFADVNQKDWYAGAVNWAYENKIVNGVSKDRFEPEEIISRQDFVTMLIRYLSSKGLSVKGNKLTYSDTKNISGYALDAMKQAQKIGLMQGYPDNTVRPNDTVIRCEGVTFIMRLVRYMEQASAA